MLSILRNATVYAPQALGRQDLVVGGGRILWLGPSAPRLPRELLAVDRDLEGRRLIPGLVDCHVHVTGGGGEAGFASRVPPLGLRRFTEAGVTSVVGLLGTDDTARSTAELLATTRALCEQGMSAWCWTGGYHVPPATLTGSVRGDIVHLDRVIGVGEVAVSDHRSSQPTLDEILRLAADAHVGGMMTGKAGVLHLHVGDGERGLELVWSALESSELPARVFHPTHVNRRKALFDEALSLAERGCTVDVTAFPVAEGEDAWSADEALLRYLDSGLPPERITVSSDGGGGLPVFDAAGRVASMDVGRPAALSACLRRLLVRGRPLEQVLPAFSSNVAAHLRLPGKGRIAAGADADLVVLAEGGEVTEVMLGGAWQQGSERESLTPHNA
ncbi:MAG: beta-aspartyl-peptidase [Planctomycetota bacterium]|nr:MAG: beta-aspartyl-peptidase [Planctomycetota bacterium]